MEGYFIHSYSLVSWRFRMFLIRCQAQSLIRLWFCPHTCPTAFLCVPRHSQSLFWIPVDFAARMATFPKSWDLLYFKFQLSSLTAVQLGVSQLAAFSLSWMLPLCDTEIWKSNSLGSPYHFHLCKQFNQNQAARREAPLKAQFFSDLPHQKLILLSSPVLSDFKHLPVSARSPAVLCFPESDLQGNHFRFHLWQEHESAVLFAFILFLTILKTGILKPDFSQTPYASAHSKHCLPYCE